MRSGGRIHGARSARGVVLLGLLAALTLMGFLVLAGAEVAVTARQRERERELLFVGEQYRRAIERYYYAAPPGMPRSLPASVEQLLLDDRYPQPVQHLRRAYTDPFDGGEWAWVRVGNGLAGLHTRAHAEPLLRANFPPRYAGFAQAGDVSQWVFQFKLPPPQRPLPAGDGVPRTPPANPRSPR